MSANECVESIVQCETAPNQITMESKELIADGSSHWLFISLDTDFSVICSPIGAFALGHVMISFLRIGEVGWNIYKQARNKQPISTGKNIPLCSRRYFTVQLGKKLFCT